MDCKVDKIKIRNIVEAMNNTIHDITTTDDQKIEMLKALAIDLFAGLGKP